jgi:hypothetical protein
MFVEFDDIKPGDIIRAHLLYEYVHVKDDAIELVDLQKQIINLVCYDRLAQIGRYRPAAPGFDDKIIESNAVLLVLETGVWKHQTSYVKVLYNSKPAYFIYDPYVVGESYYTEMFKINP